MITSFKNSKGFTLIEVVIYLALYAIIMTGALVSMYSIFGSSARNQVKAIVQEEGTFLIGKIDWALSGVHTINEPVVPPSPTSGNTLSVTKWDTSFGNPIVITVINGNMTMSRGANPTAILNNSNVLVACPPVGCFTHATSSGDGINPEKAGAIFTLHATTSEGLPFSQSFSTVKYLRK
jgi:prepilin-type N-terminal cleavage/methylation domain-containing protein